MPLLDSYLGDSTLKIVLMPSTSDVAALPVFPQPAYDARLFRDMLPAAREVRGSLPIHHPPPSLSLSLSLSLST
jgi:hypothetical protein